MKTKDKDEGGEDKKQGQSNCNGTTSTSINTNGTSHNHNKPWWNSKRKNGDQEDDQEGQGTSRYGINGFEQWGGYMGAKKAKLDVQLNVKDESEAGSSGIFKGVSVWINGYTNPPEPDLRRLFVEHGGTFHFYRSSKTTFIIATNLSLSSKNLYGSITVKPEWITESIKAGKKLNYRDYLLYNLNEEKKQRTLTQLMKQKPVENGQNGEVTKVPVPIGSDEDAVQVGDEDNEALMPSDEEIPLESEPYKISKVDGKLAAIPTSSPTRGTGRKVKTATEEGFLEDFFQHSRLHLISDLKKEMQNKIGSMRRNMEGHKFELLDEFIKSVRNGPLQNGDHDQLAEEKILMHIDLDCFFVSVGLLSRPHLRGQPVVVTHSTGKGENSKSDIASASYEARKFGVKNGMWVSGAKELCPDLVVIPYDFEEYRRVSEQFFDTVAKVTLDIEPSSVDEMVMDASSLLVKVPGASPIQLAEFIRAKIFEGIQCMASIGIGCNKLLAKLAIKKAKPNGVYHLREAEAPTFIKELEVREIPGIGWSHETKLEELYNVRYCKDLLQIPLQRLKAQFGAKTAEKMIQACKGIDTTELKYGFERPKSISVDVNYGIRFTTEEQVTDFMMKLSKEFASRAIKAQATGMNLTLRVLVKKKGAGDPKKHGGHGIVDSVTRSSRFFKPINDWNEIFRTVCKMLRLLAIPPADYRGIGMSLTDLHFEFDKTAAEKKAVQKTLFDMTRNNSRGKQMLSKVLQKPKSSSSPTKTPPSSAKKVATSPLNLSVPAAKKRRLDFSPVSKRTSSASTSTTTSTSSTITASTSSGEQIDLNVLRELPDDIAQEVARQYGIELPPSSPVKIEEPVLKEDKQSRADVGSNNMSNPYAEIDEIDAAYLCALPTAIRNEVLLQFQEAQKGRKDPIPRAKPSVETDPQPCSSRQALERDNLVKIQTDLRKLRCDEQMQEESVYTTPPSSGGSRSSNSQSRFQTEIFSSTPLMSRRKLEFPHQFKGPYIDLDRFWKDPTYRIDKIKTVDEEPVTLPILSGADKPEDARNTLRFAITMIQNPVPEDKATLFTYFCDLARNGYIKDVELLLKFMNRKVETLPSDSLWRSIFMELIPAVQEQFSQLYDYEIDLQDSFLLQY